jgi:hypothetical protein
MKKILNTRNYRLFQNNSGENRPLDIKRHKKLLESMKKYGFLECFPIVVARNGGEHLTVKDGQHRLACAETLGLSVYYVEDKTNFDVAIVNSTAKVWVPKDYAQKFAANGVKSYQEGLEFAERHSLPIGVAFALLGGTTSFGNIVEQFYDGTFKIKDRTWADAVASIYGPLTTMSAVVKNARMLEACMAVCRVPDFDAKRLLANAERCREKLVSYSTRDAYLQMLEDIYNFGRKHLVGLKSAAMMAMRERNATVKAKANKAAA